MNRRRTITPEPFNYAQSEMYSPELEAGRPPTGANRSSRDYIRWVQQSLNQIMTLRLAVDGLMGPATRSAVRSFQQKQEFDAFKRCPEFLGRRISAFGGATPFATGEQILNAIESAYNDTGCKVKDVHIFSHSRPVGISGSYRGYNTGWYADYAALSAADRASGARRTDEIDPNWLANDVTFVLYGCNLAQACSKVACDKRRCPCPWAGESFAKNLCRVLVARGLHGAKVIAHAGAPGIGANADWTEFYRDSRGTIQSRNSFVQGPFCPH